jgi:hypothetical protein
MGVRNATQRNAKTTTRNSFGTVGTKVYVLLCSRARIDTQTVTMATLEDADEYHVDDLNAVVPLGPEGLRHGVLKNGMTYDASTYSLALLWPIRHNSTLLQASKLRSDFDTFLSMVSCCTCARFCSRT